MSNSNLEQSKQPGGHHHLLQQMIGTWEGTTKTWFRPDELADESPWRGTIRALHDGNFIVHEYEGRMKDEPFIGQMMIGYNLSRACYESAWIDTFHMGSGILFSTGSRKNDTTISVHGTYSPGGGHPDWGWRTEFALPDKDQLVITCYNITPDGQEGKGVETRYHRLA